LNSSEVSFQTRFFGCWVDQTYEVLRKHRLQENFDIAACGGRLLLSKQVVSLK
jgi:hypothetical protein